MQTCIFCKIVEGELPSYKVYEDKDVLAFLDINPTKAGHTLVIPKKHYANMEEVSEDDLKKVIVAVKKVGQSFKNGLGVDSYNIVENNDPAAGQIIPHIHFHLIPRYDNDKLKSWPQAPYPEGKAEEVLEKIKIN